MTQVLVFEDEAESFLCRYSKLARAMPLSLVFVKESYLEDEVANAALIGLAEGYLDLSNINVSFVNYGELDKFDIPEADIYFCDGLNGHYKELMQRIPPSKLVVNSSNMKFTDDARANGFRTFRGDSITPSMLEGLVGDEEEGR